MQTPAPRAPLPPTSPWHRSIHTTDTSKSFCISAVRSWERFHLSFLLIHSIHFFNAMLLSTEAHSPLVILERGRFSFSQYEEQVFSRRDFIRCARKDSEPERKVGARAFPSPGISNNQAGLIHLCSCRPPAAGVCEEATPQGHSEQPRADAELLPQLGVRTFRASQSHQRAAVSGGSQR